jgi:hypothetical protein
LQKTFGANIPFFPVSKTAPAEKATARAHPKNVKNPEKSHTPTLPTRPGFFLPMYFRRARKKCEKTEKIPPKPPFSTPGLQGFHSPPRPRVIQFRPSA